MLISPWDIGVCVEVEACVEALAPPVPPEAYHFPCDGVAVAEYDGDE